jgi:hypothetical protein
MTSKLKEEILHDKYLELSKIGEGGYIKKGNGRYNNKKVKIT